MFTSCDRRVTRVSAPDTPLRPLRPLLRLAERPRLVRLRQRGGEAAHHDTLLKHLRLSRQNGASLLGDVLLFTFR